MIVKETLVGNIFVPKTKEEIRKELMHSLISGDFSASMTGCVMKLGLDDVMEEAVRMSYISPTQYFNVAYRYGRWDHLEKALKMGADVENEWTGVTRLMAAVRDNLPEAVRLLLKYGADVNYENQHGATAFTFSLVPPINFEIVEMLLKAGARVSKGDMEYINTMYLKDTESYTRLKKLLKKHNE